MDALLAALPLLAILALMLGARWSALRAGLAALLIAIVLALWRFPPGAGLDAGAASLGIAAEGGFLGAGILWILWPALALYRYQLASGALQALREGLAGLAQARPQQALLVGFLLALFLEGAAGFGTPVALTAPILVGLGFAPLRAVALALVGHAAAVGFGALGTPVLVQAALTGEEPAAIGWRVALLQGGLGLVLVAGFVRALGEASARPGWGWVALAAAGFLVPMLAIALAVGPELASLGGALVGLVLFATVSALRTARREDLGAALQRLRAPLGPYLLLIALVLASRLLPDAAQLSVSWSLFDHYRGELVLTRHPGTFLLLALLLGALWQGRGLRAAGRALAESARLLRPAALALVCMLLLSRLMLDSGMVAALQGGAVAAVGAGWPLLAPALGALGSFITGSATASNVLLSALQASAAQSMELPVQWLLAAQTLGAAVGNIVCPHNVVAGAATVGLVGREGEIIRRTLPVCLAYLLCAGVLVWLLTLH